ncbi:unnamed protein product [Ostreobium quekettii]|uniref:Uncharacterized protein n=1 Tax=Ostreobium quekettii TaxID=121088 RepID=A0A8S1ILZ1_9CHLO|nr:unnamed protein product [Ostreobium quekettii]
MCGRMAAASRLSGPARACKLFSMEVRWYTGRGRLPTASARGGCFAGAGAAMINTGHVAIVKVGAQNLPWPVLNINVEKFSLREVGRSRQQRRSPWWRQYTIG